MIFLSEGGSSEVREVFSLHFVLGAEVDRVIAFGKCWTVNRRVNCVQAVRFEGPERVRSVGKQSPEWSSMSRMRRHFGDQHNTCWNDVQDLGEICTTIRSAPRPVDEFSDWFGKVSASR